MEEADILYTQQWWGWWPLKNPSDPVPDEPPDDDTSNIVTETNTTWGVGRISHRTRGSTDYVYDKTAGEGTCAYVLDTGIMAEHPEFKGRASLVKNYDQVDGTGTDIMGHGTHVAGTITSKSFGVA